MGTIFGACHEWDELLQYSILDLGLGVTQQTGQLFFKHIQLCCVIRWTNQIVVESFFNSINLLCIKIETNKLHLVDQLSRHLSVITMLVGTYQCVGH